MALFPSDFKNMKPGAGVFKWPSYQTRRGAYDHDCGTRLVRPSGARGRAGGLPGSVVGRILVAQFVAQFDKWGVMGSDGELLRVQCAAVLTATNATIYKGKGPRGELRGPSLLRLWEQGAAGSNPAAPTTPNRVAAITCSESARIPVSGSFPGPPSGPPFPTR